MYVIRIFNLIMTTVIKYRMFYKTKVATNYNGLLSLVNQTFSSGGAY